MSRPRDALLLFEQRLRQEVDRFGEGLRHHLAERAVPDFSRSGPPESGERLRGLAAEDARLRRMARRGSLAYDLDRHIAIRRLIALLGAPSASPALRRSGPVAARGTRRTTRSG